MVKEVKNVIIQGLAFSLSKAPTDLVAVQEAENVWIDHCSFENDLDHGKVRQLPRFPLPFLA